MTSSSQLPHADERVQRLIAQEHLLDSRIAAARRMLMAPAPDAPQLVQAPPAAGKAPITRVVSRPEEVTLHREIAAQKTTLENLRLTDTEAHPDVIAGREKLDTLQDRLASYLASHGPAQVIQVAADTTPEVTEAAGVPAGQPAYHDSMPQLARLIGARAVLERQILSFTNVKEQVIPASEAPVPLLDAAPKVVAVQQQHLPVQRKSRVAFQVMCGAVALSAGVLLATIREYREEHLAGPFTLEAQLPVSTYFHSIPRMKA